MDIRWNFHTNYLSWSLAQQSCRVMTTQQLFQVILTDIGDILTSSIFWRVIAAGIVFSVGTYYPNLSQICNILVTALGVTVVVNGGQKIGGAFAGK